MRIEVDPSKCLTAGLCVLTEPRVFDQDIDQGTVVLLEEEPPEDLQAAVREAAKICPSGAIKVLEDDAG
jgi:ferredoxin